MKKDIFITDSRKNTPWTNTDNVTPIQSFIDKITSRTFEEKHKRVSDTDESTLLKGIEPEDCPYCRSKHFIRYGKTSTGLIKYKCKECSKFFNLLTGTIFQDHRIPLIDWVDYCLALFRFQSFNSISRANRNSYSTTKYWLSKIFLILEDYQKDIVLKDEVYIDETFYRVRKADITHKENAIEYRGISRNQMCIGIGTDSKNVIAIYQGNGKTSGKRTLECFSSHIKPKSTIIHDKEKAHTVLIKELELKDVSYNAKSLQGLSDKENPLYPINHRCYLLKKFLDAHSSFLRDDLQDYLNLFCFIMNEGLNPYEKLENLLLRALRCRKTLTFRDKFSNHV